MINYAKILRRNLQALDAPQKTYAVAQSRDTMDIEKLAEHIAGHGNTYDAGDVIAITKKIVSCIRELLLDGYNVNLGDLGTFGIQIKSRGVSESEIDEKTGLKPVFTAADITDVSVRWTKSKKFRNLMDDVKFNEVPTLKEKAAALKAKHEQLADGTQNGNEEDDEESKG